MIIYLWSFTYFVVSIYFSNTIFTHILRKLILNIVFRIDYINEVLHENQLDISNNCEEVEEVPSCSVYVENSTEDWDDGLTFTAKPSCKYLFIL